MNILHEYVQKVHDLIEVPRDDLRKKVYQEKKMEYADLLEKFEQEHFQKCLKIEELLEEEYKELERRKKRNSS